MIHPGGPGDGFHGPAKLRERVCHIREDARVLPYVARGFRRRQVRYTRVQKLGVGGQLSNSVQSNVKSGEIGPYRTYPASTRVPEQLPPPLDSASYEIGQSVQPVGTGPGDGVWLVRAGSGDGRGGDADQGAGDSGVVSDVVASAGQAIKRNSPL